MAAPIVAALRAEAAAWLAEERVPEADRQIETVALMRYAGQGGELSVPWHDDAEAAMRDFAAAHAALYGFTMDAPIELVTLRVEAIGRLPPSVTAPPPREGTSAPTGHTAVHFRTGTRNTPIHARETLPAGLSLAGPCIVTQLDATTLVPPGWTMEVLASGSLSLRRGDR